MQAPSFFFCHAFSGFFGATLLPLLAPPEIRFLVSRIPTLWISGIVANAAMSDTEDRQASREASEAEDAEENEEAFSGSDSSSSEEDEGERRRSKKSKKSSKRRSSTERRSRSRDGGRRKKRRAVNAFLDVEAQEGDDEEEEDNDDLFDYSEEAAQAARLAAQATERRVGSREDRAQQRRGGASHLESAIDSLTRRYQDQTFEEGEEEDDLDADGFALEDPNENNLLPDITDPKLWMVKLNKTGVEREVCISILNKSFQMQEKGKDCEIYSCYASDDLKGYVYVEAFSQYAIKEALQGLRLIRTYGEIKMVPLEEMTAVFNSVRSRAPYIPQRNDFVRVKRGLYANDIAQIHQVEEQGMVVTVRLIPRLDLNALLDREKRGDFSRKSDMATLKQMGGVRAQKRFFDRDEVDARGGQVEQGILPGTVRFAGMTFEESGYLLRRMAVRHLLVGSAAAPSLAEVTEFVQQGKDEDDLHEIRRPLSSFLKRQRSAYRLGERVRVIGGELQGMRGKIGERRQEPEDDDEEESVEVIFDDRKLGPVMLKASHVVKDLQLGENVRAVGGVNAGHSGLITSIDLAKQTATVFSPAAGLEFTCGLESLTVAPDAGLGEEGLSSVRGFHLGDFVELTSGEKGVLVFIDKNESSIRILLPSNSALCATAAQLASKRSTDLLTTLDESRVTVEKGATVVITKTQEAAPSLAAGAAGSFVGSTLGNLLGIPTTAAAGLGAQGPQGPGGAGTGGLGLKGAHAKVLHVCRDRLFLKVMGRSENGGIIAVDAKHVRVSGHDFRSPGFPQDAFTRNAHSQLARAQRGRGALRGGLGSWGPATRGGRGGMHRNPYLGKLVKIMRGRYRGLMATVRRVEQSELHVLLQMKEKELKIPKSDAQLIESSREYQSFVGGMAAPPPSSLGSGMDSLSTPLAGVSAGAQGGVSASTSLESARGASSYLLGPSGASLSSSAHGRTLTPVSSSAAFMPPSLASGDLKGDRTACFFDARAQGESVRRGSVASSMKIDDLDFDGHLLTPREDDAASNSSMSMSVANASTVGGCAQTPDWCCPGVEVCVIAGTGGYRGKIGAIGQILPQDDHLLCHVYIGEEDLIAIAAESLTPVIPEQPDPNKRVMILDRDCSEFGKTGIWVQAISPTCAVIRTQNAGEVMCNPRLLVNFNPPPEEDE
uniref:KOW motif domain-containing protein n=3 Tax=Toxoplasma gondii TaxID=5811 RepID=A0A2G8Y766_TOXGO|nr:KOW motif domain-containing protein [Toxoplasma gondii COUG]